MGYMPHMKNHCVLTLTLTMNAPLPPTPNDVSRFEANRSLSGQRGLLPWFINSFCFWVCLKSFLHSCSPLLSFSGAHSFHPSCSFHPCNTIIHPHTLCKFLSLLYLEEFVFHNSVVPLPSSTCQFFVSYRYPITCLYPFVSPIIISPYVKQTLNIYTANSVPRHLHPYSLFHSCQSFFYYCYYYC